MNKKNKNGLEEKIDKLTSATERGFKEINKKFDEKIDDLAAMVSRGFEETASKAELEEVKTRLDRVDMRLDRIENILLRDHNNRIERLEDKLLQVEVILGKKLLK